MVTNPRPSNRVRELRVAQGLTQAELAERAGVSRTAITAIEGERLSPSVAAALAIAQTLGASVEELFGSTSKSSSAEAWAWEPISTDQSRWRAKVGDRVLQYPAFSAPMWTPLPDGADASHASDGAPADTLTLACCDPAAGLLASQYARATGGRLLTFPRSSRQSLEMLRQGVVHLAGVHFATMEAPNRNLEVIRETLGDGFQLARVARWREGVVSAPAAKIGSVRQALASRLTWVGREPGSGAGICLDRIFEDRPKPKRMARHHQGVVEAIRSGWADAGVCVQLVGAEAGLDFLAVQDEYYDVCYPKDFADDRRLKSFLQVLRSAAFRKLLSALPGYDVTDAGETQ